MSGLHCVLIPVKIKQEEYRIIKTISGAESSIKKFCFKCFTLKFFRRSKTLFLKNVYE